jgi:hypothetical protein
MISEQSDAMVGHYYFTNKRCFQPGCGKMKFRFKLKEGTTSALDGYCEATSEGIGLVTKMIVS